MHRESAIRYFDVYAGRGELRLKMWKVQLLKLALIGLATSAWSQSSEPDIGLTVTNGWVRASEEIGGVAAVYFTLQNESSSKAVVVGVRTDVASIVTFHKTVVGSTGAERMSAIPELRIPAGATAVLQPGGLHLMLIDLEESLVDGQILPLQLEMRDGSQLSIEVLVSDKGVEGTSG